MARASDTRFYPIHNGIDTAHPSPGRNAPTIKEGWRKVAKLDTTFALLFIPDAFLFPEPSQDLADIKCAE
jgi:hypothetical protein